MTPLQIGAAPRAPSRSRVGAAPRRPQGSRPPALAEHPQPEQAQRQSLAGRAARSRCQASELSLKIQAPPPHRRAPPAPP
eukprot:4090418-Prymnesium_polylepis.1